MDGALDMRLPAGARRRGKGDLMARSTPSKTAARTAARPARRAPRARTRAAAAPDDKAVEAGIARAAEHAPAASPAHPHGPEAFGAAIGGFLNSLSGLQ